MHFTLYSNVLHTVQLIMLTGTIEILDLTVRSAYARTQTESLTFNIIIISIAVLQSKCNIM